MVICISAPAITANVQGALAPYGIFGPLVRDASLPTVAAHHLSDVLDGLVHFRHIQANILKSGQGDRRRYRPIVLSLQAPATCSTIALVLTSLKVELTKPEMQRIRIDSIAMLFVVRIGIVCIATACGRRR